jgi:long-subunit acyl-CoA synthetase (AMP-forming)
MTECSPLNFTTVRQDDIALQATKVGLVAEHWEAKVVDTNGRMVPFGEPGELWVRGYGTMLGYWDDPEATAATIRGDGWLKTG